MNSIFLISKRIASSLAIVFSVVSLMLCWIGFSVPDWLTFEDTNQVRRKFGLWVFCYQDRSARYPVYSCQSWVQDQIPDFLRTSQVLITLGCLLCTFGVLTGIVSLLLKNGYYKILPLVAGIFCLLSFILVVIGIAVFGNDHSFYAEKIAGKSYNRRWGYWIFSPAVIFLLFATFFYPLSFLSESSNNNDNNLKKSGINFPNKSPFNPIITGSIPPNLNRDPYTSNYNSQNFNTTGFPNPNNQRNNNFYPSQDAFKGPVFQNSINNSRRNPQTEKKWAWERI